MKRFLFALVLSVFIMVSGAHAAAILYGVTGDGATISETLYRLNTTNASATFVTALGNGSGGETLAYNPTDGLMYHWSGLGGGAIFESIDLGTLSITDIPFNDEYVELTGATYDTSCDCFLAYDIDDDYFSITPTGTVTSLNTNDVPEETMRGLSFVESTLYGGGRSSDQLHSIAPSTGASTGSVTITSGVGTVDGVIGLSMNPDTGDLFAILRFGTGKSHDRRLATINPLTGVATDIGLLSDKVAAIAFAVPVPGAVWLFGSALGLLGWMRRKSA